MPHTQSRYMQDLGFTDGKIFAGIGDLTLISGTAPLTKNAFGDYSFNLGNSATCVFGVNLSTLILRRLGMFEDLQEQFGGGGIPGSAQPQAYRPDQIPSMSSAQQLQPRAAFKTKGFRLKSLDVIQLISGAAITTNQIGIAMNQHVNNVANNVTTILALAANGLPTAVQANPYVTTISLTSAQQALISNVPGGIPGYHILNDTGLWVEVDMTTPGGGTARLYGVDISIEYNFN